MKLTFLRAAKSYVDPASDRDRPVNVHTWMYVK